MKQDIAKRKVKMKQRKIVSMIGMLVVLLCTLFIMTGCPTGQEPQNEQGEQWKPDEKAFFDITYDLIDCTYNGSEGSLEERISQCG